MVEKEEKMVKARKVKSSTLSRAPLISEESRLVQLRAARIRAVDGADERAQWVQRSAQVLKGIVQRAAADGVFVGAVLAGPVRQAKKPGASKSLAGSKALVLRKKPK